MFAAVAYSRDMDLITSTAALRDVCARLAEQPFVTVDTEFMRETTYYPKLCLIQMAAPDGTAALVDPLAPGIDLQPFIDLMADERTREGVPLGPPGSRDHLADGRVLPHPFFDTQVAAMVCGYGDSVSYEQLVNDVAKAKIDKSSRFTDWSRRPLSEAQLSLRAFGCDPPGQGLRGPGADCCAPTAAPGWTRRWRF